MDIDWYWLLLIIIDCWFYWIENLGYGLYIANNGQKLGRFSEIVDQKLRTSSSKDTSKTRVLKSILFNSVVFHTTSLAFNNSWTRAVRFSPSSCWSLSSRRFVHVHHFNVQLQCFRSSLRWNAKFSSGLLYVRCMVVWHQKFLLTHSALHPG